MRAFLIYQGVDASASSHNDMEDHQADAGKLAELAAYKELVNYVS